ncbi:exo-beta-N-acetylmuramidase NamZ family protein [Neobacillus sp. Marseille-QA0830]
MKIGLDVLFEKNTLDYKGKRIGLVTNMTGVNQKLTPTIDLFHGHPDLHLTALYGPEHGIRGSAKEGEKVESFVDPYTNVPVYSLYGASKKPSKDMLDPVDVVFFDLQDIGARYYTYIYTMAYMMESCAEHGKQFVVLDRPNPISGTVVEGNLVEEGFRSFVGLYPIPNRHGMTVGELALIFKHEFGIACDLTVIPMEDWNRGQYYDETGLFWVPPSPNTTGIDMATLYPGTCLMEGTNLSEGRGTTRPFEYVGAPYIDGYRLAKAFNEKRLPGVLARPISFNPTYQKHKDSTCEGVQLHVVDRKAIHSLKTGLTLLEIIAEMYPNDFGFVQYGEKPRYMMDLLAGTDRLRNQILTGTTNVFLEQCEEQSEAFKTKREPYLLYK